MNIRETAQPYIETKRANDVHNVVACDNPSGWWTVQRNGRPIHHFAAKHMAHALADLLRASVTSGAFSPRVELYGQHIKATADEGIDPLATGTLLRIASPTEWVIVDTAGQERMFSIADSGFVECAGYADGRTDIELLYASEVVDFVA